MLWCCDSVDVVIPLAFVIQRWLQSHCILVLNRVSQKPLPMRSMLITYLVWLDHFFLVSYWYKHKSVLKFNEQLLEPIDTSCVWWILLIPTYCEHVFYWRESFCFKVLNKQLRKQECSSSAPHRRTKCINTIGKLNRETM